MQIIFDANKMYKEIIILIICTLFASLNGASLDLVNDDELTNLIRTEKYVVVLFCKYILYL